MRRNLSFLLGLLALFMVVWSSVGCSSEPPADATKIKDVPSGDRSKDMSGRPDLSGGGKKKMPG